MDGMLDGKSVRLRPLPSSPSSVTVATKELPKHSARSMSLGAPLLRRASSMGKSMRALPEASVQLAQRNLRKGVEVANAAQQRAAELQAQAQLKLAEEHKISAAKLYFLTAATMLLVVIGIYFTTVAALKFLARVEVVWFFTRSAKLDDFRQWTQEVCMEPWQRESVLCQAVEGNWLARELARAKIQQAGTHHCDPALVPGGCAHTPCRSKGLSSKLMELKDAWSSPLNNRLSPMYYVLLPVRKRVKDLLKKLAQGDMPLSQLEKELHTFPLLERQFSFLIRTNRDDNFGWYILNEFAYPALRDWGVHIGGATPKPPKVGSCAEPFAPMIDGMLERLEEAKEDSFLSSLYPPKLLYSAGRLAAGGLGTAMASIGGHVGDAAAKFGQQVAAVLAEEGEAWVFDRTGL